MSPLSDFFSKPDFHKRLEKALGLPVKLRWINDDYRKLTVHREGETVFLDLHPLFEASDARTIRNMVDFIRTRSDLSKALLIDYLKEAVSKDPNSRRLIEGKGEIYHLGKMMNGLLHLFENFPDTSVAWSKFGKKSPRRSIRLGSYWPMKREIRIHPVLDDNRVSQLFVEYTLYHEMCHAYLISTTGNTELVQHTGEFKELEKKFPKFDEAKAWEHDSLALYLAEIGLNASVEEM